MQIKGSCETNHAPFRNLSRVGWHWLEIGVPNYTASQYPKIGMGRCHSSVSTCHDLLMYFGTKATSTTHSNKRSLHL